MEKPISILVVDGHPFVRKSLRAYLSSIPEFDVLGEADSGEEANLLIKQYRPDVVLVDLTLPGICGLETSRIIKKVSPRTKVIVLTPSHNSELIYKALKSGAISYISKDQKMENLTRTIQRAVKGQISIPPSVATLILENSSSFMNHNSRDKLCELTDQESKILNLMADGYSNKKIADKLSVNERFVNDLTQKILSKFQVETR